MGFTLTIEGRKKLFYGKNIISSVQVALYSPSSSKARAASNTMTVVISGKLYADSKEISNETICLYKWALLPAGEEEVYRKVSIKIDGTSGRKFRVINLSKAFVAEYNERYDSKMGVGNFTMVIRQKGNAINDVKIDTDL